LRVRHLCLHSKAYLQHLKWVLKSEFCVGIIGGKPQASLFLIGYQDNDVIYLDPHVVQDAVKPTATFNPALFETYHCKIPLKMPLSNIDPTLAIGLLFHSKENFISFVKSHKEFEKLGEPLMFFIEET